MNNFMQLALEEAKKAYVKDEVPVGAVIVMDGKVIAKTHNMREKKQNALYHAEVLAINKACKKKRSWRLDGAVMYVTLMPCPMCAGAILNARIAEVVYATDDENDKGLFARIMGENTLNHFTKFRKDDENQFEAKTLLQSFFRQRRS